MKATFRQKSRSFWISMRRSVDKDGRCPGLVVMVLPTERIGAVLASGLTTRDIAVTLGVNEKQIRELIQPPARPEQELEKR